MSSIRTNWPRAHFGITEDQLPAVTGACLCDEDGAA